MKFIDSRSFTSPNAFRNSFTFGRIWFTESMLFMISFGARRIIERASYFSSFEFYIVKKPCFFAGSIVFGSTFYSFGV